jgi:hypothetical protein
MALAFLYGILFHYVGTAKTFSHLELNFSAFIHFMRLKAGIREKLAIVAMRCWSQELLQSPIQNVKKEGLLDFFVRNVYSLRLWRWSKIGLKTKVLVFFSCFQVHFLRFFFEHFKSNKKRRGSKFQKLTMQFLCTRWINI